MNSSTSLFVRAGGIAAALAFSTTVADAQTLYGIDGPAMTVYEMSGPPAAPCGYPTGPVLSAFPTVPGICPGPVAFPFGGGGPGDVAVDQLTDTIWASDGGVIASYTAGGAPIDSFFAPIAVVGMGIDAAAGMLWVTDGFVIGMVPPPPAPGCFAAPPPLVGAFPTPIAPGMFAGPITDIEWDPSTGTLFACDVTGIVGNFLPGGPPGPFGYGPVGALGCIAGPLEGIAIDTTIPGGGVFWVTDGLTVSHGMLPGPVVPAPTFHSPIPCYPVGGGPVSGLAFSSHAIPFSVPSTTGAALPFAAGVGNSFVGNPGFAVTVTGLPGSGATLFYGPGGPSCPPIPALGLLLNLFPAPPLVPLGTVVVGAGGVGTLPLPIPPVFPAGTAIDLQWLVVEPTGLFATSDGLHATLALP